MYVCYTDLGTPNTPLAKLIEQIPAMVVGGSVCFAILCALIFSSIVVVSCFVCPCNNQKQKYTLKYLDRRLTKTKDPDNIFSGEIAETIICQCMQHLGESGQVTNGKPIQNYWNVIIGLSRNHIYSHKNINKGNSQGESNTEGGNNVLIESATSSKPLPKSTQTMTKFLVGKLYVGLSNSKHGPTLRCIIAKVIAETDTVRRRKKESDVESGVVSDTDETDEERNKNQYNYSKLSEN